MIKTIPITIVREIVLTDDSFVIINKSFHSLLKLLKFNGFNNDFINCKQDYN